MTEAENFEDDLFADLYVRFLRVNSKPIAVLALTIMLQLR